MKKNVLFVLVLLLNVFFLSSCSKDDEASGDAGLLVGRWSLESTEGGDSVLEGGASWIEFLGSGDYFDSNGGGGSWSLKGDKLYATSTIGIPAEYTVLELTENRLKMRISVNLGDKNYTMTLVYVC